MVLENGLFTVTPALDDDNRTIISPEKLFLVTPEGTEEGTIFYITDEDYTSAYGDTKTILATTSGTSGTHTTLLTYDKTISAAVIWLYYSQKINSNQFSTVDTTVTMDISLNGTDWTQLETFDNNHYSTETKKNYNAFNKKFKYLRIKTTYTMTAHSGTYNTYITHYIYGLKVVE